MYKRRDWLFTHGADGGGSDSSSDDDSSSEEEASGSQDATGEHRAACFGVLLSSKPAMHAPTRAPTCAQAPRRVILRSSRVTRRRQVRLLGVQAVAGGVAAGGQQQQWL